ncbi:pectate lyase [Melioribacter sp. OK-6-Me]
MNKRSLLLIRLLIASIIIICLNEESQPQSRVDEISYIKKIIRKSCEYMDEKVSTEGGYVWYYKKDFSRRWGELEAYPSMIWIQGNGTVAMGHLFLDLYETLKDSFYLNLSKKTALALMKAQLDCGGWNYLSDLNGDESLIKWYETIGKNAWRLEEFNHYFGNATFDDNSTAGAAEYLLRYYLISGDTSIEKSLNKAIDFILKSQYDNGAWPQRYPIIDSTHYSAFYTYNDYVIWNNLKFLILCYASLKYESLFKAIEKAMNFYILSQYKKPQAGWAQQYNFNLEPAPARTYELAALDPQYTAHHIEMLIKFYEMTCDEKYLKIIPDALAWIETVKFNDNEINCRVPKFVELNTNKPLFIHRSGSNSRSGKYYVDYDSNLTVIHYPCISKINLKRIKDLFHNAKCNQYEYMKLLFPFQVMNKTGIEIYYLLSDYLKIGHDRTNRKRGENEDKINTNIIDGIISSVDTNYYWYTKNAYISNEFIDIPSEIENTNNAYAVSYVGDKYDTSPFPNISDEKFISTAHFIRNIRTLLDYIKKMGN